MVEISNDRRIRLTPKATINDVFGTNLFGPMAPLRETNGILFPYTPEIAISQAPDYQSLGLTHTNQDWYYYTRTPSLIIGLSNCIFTSSTVAEAKYTFAVIHFLRSVIKMEFGVQARARGKSGLPPPLFNFSGYGDGMFNKIPVILKDYTYSLPNDVDYVRIKQNDIIQTGDTDASSSTLPGWSAWVPLILNLNITLIVQNVPQKWRDEFDLAKFKNGDFIKSGGWW